MEKENKKMFLEEKIVLGKLNIANCAMDYSYFITGFSPDVTAFKLPEKSIAFLCVPSICHRTPGKGEESFVVYRQERLVVVPAYGGWHIDLSNAGDKIMVENHGNN